MRVSVIVPVKNNAKLLSKLLKTLSSQTLKPYEVIVVDDGSVDGSPQVAKAYGAIVLCTGGGKGPNFARSLGVKNAKGDIVAFTDSDCTPSRDWIKSLVEDFQRCPEASVVVGTTIAANPDAFLARFLDNSLLTPTPKYAKRLMLKNDFKPGIIVATCNMAVLRQVFEKVGLFDPAYKYYGSDDMDFVYRVLKNGFVVLCSPKPLVRHHHRASLNNILKRYFQYGQGFAIFLKRYPKSVFSISVGLAIVSLITLLSLSVITAFTNPSLSLALFLLAFSPVLIYHLLRAIRKRSPEMLAYPFLDFMLALASCAGFLFMLSKMALKVSLRATLGYSRGGTIIKD